MEIISLFFLFFVLLLLLGHSELALANRSIRDGILLFELRKGLSLCFLLRNKLCTRVLLSILCALQTKGRQKLDVSFEFSVYRGLT